MVCLLSISLFIRGPAQEETMKKGTIETTEYRLCQEEDIPANETLKVNVSRDMFGFFAALKLAAKMAIRGNCRVRIYETCSEGMFHWVHSVEPEFKYVAIPLKGEAIQFRNSDEEKETVTEVLGDYDELMIKELSRKYGNTRSIMLPMHSVEDSKPHLMVNVLPINAPVQPNYDNDPLYEKPKGEVPE